MKRSPAKASPTRSSRANSGCFRMPPISEFASDATANFNPQRVTHVRIAHGVMIQTSENREETVYTIRDDDTTPRTVLIEHPLRVGWTIAGEHAQARRNNVQASTASASG